MAKFFEYDDPGMAAHVDRIEGLAKDMEENETVVKSDPTIYANNNKDKPFAPMTGDDVSHRYSLGAGGGKDRFVVADHREEQKKIIEKYQSMSSWDREAGGVFHVSEAQISKVAQAVVDKKVKDNKSMGFFKRIKAAISFSEEAKKKRANMKALKEVVKKGHSQ